MGSLRKYLFNGAIISAVLSGVSALRQQRKAPSDWRTWLNWLVWALTLVIALGTVRQDSIEKALPDEVRKKRTRPAKGPKAAKDKR